jgi:hypothetical protein
MPMPDMPFLGIRAFRHLLMLSKTMPDMLFLGIRAFRHLLMIFQKRKANFTNSSRL